MTPIDEWWPQRAIALLTEAGWSPGRAVDITEWRAELAGKGFVMHAAAERVLTEFGGLLLEAEGAGLRSGRCALELDPALGAGPKKSFDDFAVKAGTLGLYSHHQPTRNPRGPSLWGARTLQPHADLR